MKISRIEHLGIAVQSIDEVLPYFQDVLGLEVNMRAPGGYIPPTDVADLWRFIDEIPYWTAEKHGLKRVSVSCGRDFQHLAAINNTGIANDFTVSLINLSPTSSGTIKIQGNIP